MKPRKSLAFLTAALLASCNFNTSSDPASSVLSSQPSEPSSQSVPASSESSLPPSSSASQASQTSQASQSASASKSSSSKTSRTSSSTQQSSAVSSSASQGSSESSSNPKHMDNYESWINSWSQKGHLYIHYLRPGENQDYEKYCIWLWQHRPQDLEGSLWGFGSNTKVSDKLTLKPMSTKWMQYSDVGKGSEGSGSWDDEYGHIMDIDLGRSDIVGGKTGEAVTYDGATEVGFLMVDEASMGGKTNWTSDGGKETYIKNFDQNFRENGSMHVFLVSGDFKNYKFESGQQDIRINPVTGDKTGDYRSKTQTISGDLFNQGATGTSDAFKSLGVGYQVFVPSFRDSDGDGLGDIRGIIDSLDYLKGLGTQVLWLTPIQQSDSYHGYDISDYFAVDPKFGTIGDYRELIYKAHQKGMKVLMDLVLNHTSKNNVWFEKSQWAVNSPGAETDASGIEWRNVYSWKYGTDKIIKYMGGSYKTITVEEDAVSDNPSWYRDGESNYYYYGKFGSGMPEINYEYQPTRDLVKDMAKYWLSFGLDGYRLDAVKHIYMKDEVASTGNDIIITDVGTKRAFDDERGKYVEKDFDYSSDLNKNIVWWKEFALDLKSVFPDCFLVGENFDGWGTRMGAYYQAMDSQFDFANYYHICQYLYANPEHNGQGQGGAGQYAASEPGETFDVFASSSSFALGDTGVSVPGGKRKDFINGAFTSNHDVPRAINQANGTWAGMTDTKASTKITGTATEIGKAKIHAAVTMLLPGLSWIYYGDELGMSGNTDTHIAKYGNENSEDIWYRQPMKWAKTAVEGTTNYKAGQYTFEWDSHNQNLDGVKEQMGKNGSMYEWYKALNSIKAQYPKGAKVSFENGNDILILNIWGEGATFKIYINCGQMASEAYMINPGSGFSQVQNSVLANGATPTSFGSTRYSVLVYKK